MRRSQVVYFLPSLPPPPKLAEVLAERQSLSPLARLVSRLTFLQRQLSQDLVIPFLLLLLQA